MSTDASGQHGTTNAGDSRGDRVPARRRRRILTVGGALVLLAVVGFVAVLAVRTSTGLPSDSGAGGLVLLGPLRPVEQVGGPPNERPYEAAVRIERAGSDDVVATARSGADGRFRVALAPGRYIVVGGTPGSFVPPIARPLEITVVAHRFTAVTLRFDTGIR